MDLIYSSGEKIQVNDIVQFIGTPITFNGIICNTVKIGDLGVIKLIEDDPRNYCITVSWFNRNGHVIMIASELKLIRRNGNELMTWL